MSVSAQEGMRFNIGVNSKYVLANELNDMLSEYSDQAFEVRKPFEDYGIINGVHLGFSDDVINGFRWKFAYEFNVGTSGIAYGDSLSDLWLSRDIYYRSSKFSAGGQKVIKGNFIASALFYVQSSTFVMDDFEYRGQGYNKSQKGYGLQLSLQFCPLILRELLYFETGVTLPFQKIDFDHLAEGLDMNVNNTSFYALEFNARVGIKLGGFIIAFENRKEKPKRVM